MVTIDGLKQYAYDVIRHAFASAEELPADGDFSVVLRIVRRDGHVSIERSVNVPGDRWTQGSTAIHHMWAENVPLKSPRCEVHHAARA